MARRPSRCSFLSSMFVLATFIRWSSTAAIISASEKVSSSFSTASCSTAAIAFSRSARSVWLRASASFPPRSEGIAASNSALTSAVPISTLGRPQARCRPSCNFIISWFASCPSLTASKMSSSETSLAPASSITMASLVLATTRSSRLSFIWGKVGFNTRLPLMQPIRTAAIGPLKGKVEIAKAAEAPITARTSGSFSWSVERTVTTT